MEYNLFLWSFNIWVLGHDSFISSFSSYLLSMVLGTFFPIGRYSTEQSWQKFLPSWNLPFKMSPGEMKRTPAQEFDKRHWVRKTRGMLCTRSERKEVLKEGMISQLCHCLKMCQWIREFCLIIMSNPREMTKCFLVWNEINVPRLIYYNVFYLLIFSEQNRQPGSVYLYCTKERYDFVVINLMYTYIYF